MAEILLDMCRVGKQHEIILILWHNIKSFMVFYDYYLAESSFYGLLLQVVSMSTMAGLVSAL